MAHTGQNVPIILVVSVLVLAIPPGRSKWLARLRRAWPQGTARGYTVLHKPIAYGYYSRLVSLVRSPNVVRADSGADPATSSRHTEPCWDISYRNPGNPRSWFGMKLPTGPANMAYLWR